MNNHAKHHFYQAHNPFQFINFEKCLYETVNKIDIKIIRAAIYIKKYIYARYIKLFISSIEYMQMLLNERIV